MSCFVATTLCFNERAIYTHDVLAVVIQQLVDVNPIPVLFMRTVLQALSFYPKMVGFVMNILQRLITKQVGLETKTDQGDRERIFRRGNKRVFGKVSSNVVRRLVHIPFLCLFNCHPLN